MKNETSILIAGLFLSAGLVACSPEKPESEKAVDGKTSGTNELVIANSDANALPSQEEDFSEETKAKLKKLREDAAILKAKAELDTAKRKATEAAAANYTGVTAGILAFDDAEVEQTNGRKKAEKFKIIKPMSSETFESNLKVVEQFGFLNKYSNKDELMSAMRSIFAKAVNAGESSVSAENVDTVIDDIESNLMQSGVKARDVNEVKKVLMHNLPS